MTVHFVNLVSWRYFTRTNNKHKKIFLDSISIVFLAKFLCKYEETRVSGVNFYGVNRDVLKEAIYLTPEKSGLNKNEFVLPYWNSVDEVNLSQELSNRIAPFERVVIGISSNKQEVLAELIQKVYPDKVVYCLGAAISSKSSYQSFDKFGLTWLVFMIASPSRAYVKIKATLSELLKIIFNKEYRSSFIEFIAEASR